METFVVCAACRKDGLILCGARHFDTIIRSAIKKMGLPFTGWEQGFIDQRGNFLTRKEAWVIADKMGQIRRPTGFESFSSPRVAGVGDEGKLFSENLY